MLISRNRTCISIRAVSINFLRAKREKRVEAIWAVKGRERMSKAWGRRWFVQRQGMRSILSRNNSIPCAIPLPPSPNKAENEKKIEMRWRIMSEISLHSGKFIYMFSISKVKHSDQTVRIIFQLKKIIYSLSTSYYFQKEKIHPKPANRVYTVLLLRILRTFAPLSFTQ